MRFFRDVLFVVVTSAAFILLLEGGLRLAHVRSQASFYQPEQERVFALRPDAAGWNVSENENYVHINSDGMRDHERPISRPRNTLRIAILGASEAEGRQVPLEKTFASVLNRHLDQALSPLGQSVDVMNFAVNGYTFSQQYLTLHNHVWKYDPQIVILTLVVPNIFKNTRELNWAEPPPPFYVLQNGHLVPDDPTRAGLALNPKLLYWKNRFADWMNCSALLSLLNEALNQARVELQKAHHALAAATGLGKTTATYGGRPGDQLTRSTYLPYAPETQEAWAIGEAFLDAMREDCSVHGAEFWVVTVDSEIQSNPSLPERARFVSEMRIPSLAESDLRIEHFGDTHGIPIILLAPPLGDYAAAHGIALHGFSHPTFNTGYWPANTGHWNELGHELAGAVVAQQLLQRSSVVRSWTSAANLNLPRPH